MTKSERVLRGAGSRDPFERLERLGVAHLTDACRELSVPYQLADERLRPIDAGLRLAGTAVTLRLRLAQDAPPYRDGVRSQFARGESVPAAVFVVRNDVPGWDTVGAFDARLAQASGYVGYLCDGPARDTQAIGRLQFPVWATGIRADCIRLADLPAGTSIEFAFGETVVVGGMSVEPGTIIVADEDGVVAIGLGRLVDLLVVGERLVNRETELLARLDTGATVDELLADAFG